MKKISLIILSFFLTTYTLNAQCAVGDDQIQNHDGATTPAGWTVDDQRTSAGGYWLLTDDAGSTPNGEGVISAAIDVSTYTDLTINTMIAKFGSGANKPAIIEYSIDNGATYAGSFTTATPTSSSPYIASGDFVFTVPGGITQLVIRISREGSGTGGDVRIQDFFLCGTPIVQPVEFTSFNGEFNNGAVDLNWSTATESNSDYFEVQHSTDGANWSALGSVAAAGNTQIAQNYSFSDTQPAKGNNFYRLKQVDLDGVFEFSDVIRIAVGSKFEVINFDASGRLNFEVFTPTSGRMTYEMYSMDGRLVANGVEEVGNGVSNVEVEASSLQSGVYVIRFTNGNESISHKFFKR